MARVRLAVLVLVAGLLAGCAGSGSASGIGVGAGAASDPAGSPVVPLAAFSATVDRVVDGDTFVALVHGRRVRVRLIGVDAPETVKEGAPVGCFGPQASAYLKALLRPRTTVRGAYEDGGRTDRFGRDLWDVWLPDGRFVQGLLVAGGYARARQIRPQHDHAQLLAATQGAAKASRAGSWGACPAG